VIASMDHIVINVVDVEAMVAFYVEVLMLAPERAEAYRQGKAPFPSVRLNAETIIDFFPRELWDAVTSAGSARVNMNHFCLTVTRDDWRALRERLAVAGVEIEVGPVPRWGAAGVGTSIYFRDPEHNLVEVRTYEL
jgi:catechol 2,3-dioxygenase-like lactoylglutathione lyase family enzyme